MQLLHADIINPKEYLDLKLKLNASSRLGPCMKAHVLKNWGPSEIIPRCLWGSWGLVYMKDWTNLTTVSSRMYLFPYMMNGRETTSLLDRSAVRESAFVLMRCSEAMPLEVVQLIDVLSGLTYFLDFISFSRKRWIKSENWNFILFFFLRVCGIQVQLPKILPSSITHIVRIAILRSITRFKQVFNENVQSLLLSRG